MKRFIAYDSLVFSISLLLIFICDGSNTFLLAQTRIKPSIQTTQLAENAQNIDVELLDSRAKLIRAWPRPLGMVTDVDESFDAVVFVGFHAQEGDPSVLAHTFLGNVELELNRVHRMG